MISMEFYDKLVDIFQEVSKVKNPDTKAKGLIIITESFQKKMFWGI